jgi:hypothetical protein
MISQAVSFSTLDWLNENINARKAKMQGRGADTSHFQREDESLVIGREHGGYLLPTGKLTMDGVREMAARLQSGERLRSASLKRETVRGCCGFGERS